MRFKEKKAISLISLVITIIVIAILSGIAIVVIEKNNIIDSIKETKFATDISMYYEEYNMYILKRNMENSDTFENEQINADKREFETAGVLPIQEVIPSMNSNYYLDRIRIENGIWICSNFTQGEQKIIENIVKETKKEEKPSEEAEESGNKYTQAAVNPPIPPTANQKWIKNQVWPVEYTENGNAIMVDDISKKWYQYEIQKGDTTEGGTSRWANMQTKEGSLWVWIPRFAYRITSGAHSKVGYQESNRLIEGEAGTIEIQFLKGNSNEFCDSSVQGTIVEDPLAITYTDTGSKIMQNEWFVPPAFAFGEKEITGFWVAKYEASSVEGNENNMAGDNVLETKIIQIKPGVSSWRYIDTKKMFGNCMFMGTKNEAIYGLANKSEVHLMKNGEWGATAYLAHSPYGRNGTAIKANTSEEYITGTGGILASTTGNYYGIFDMVGGASDAVAGVSVKDKEMIESIEEKLDIEKYVDLYSIYDSSKKGDAMYETSIRSSTTTSWFKGLSWSVNDSETRINRGGMYAKYGNAGDENPSIFGFYRYKIVDYQIKYVGFRPTIVV